MSPYFACTPKEITAVAATVAVTTAAAVSSKFLIDFIFILRKIKFCITTKRKRRGETAPLTENDVRS